MILERYKSISEVTAVFAVFFLFGAWKVPDVNEAHYICKAIHFWNPDWIPNDPFLQSKDAHWTFYMVFGWLSIFCSPAVMAWIGRIVAWLLLAWSWQRLSYALLPVRWAAIPTALALGYYIESFNMAGEWLIGGIEGKSLAYPFVFFALEAILRNRWNRAGIFLGIATALHVLVGGWATVIAAGLFLRWRRTQTFNKTPTEPQSLDCDSMATKSPTLPPSVACHLPSFPWFGLILGGFLALCGLIPGLTLDSDAPSEVVHQAHQIYAFNRLSHHLVPYEMKAHLIFRFALLTLVWILLCRHTGRKYRIFNSFIWGTLLLSVIGWSAALTLSGNKELSAEVLRFYWFRLADIAVPMGVAIGATRFCFVRLSKVQSLPMPLFSQVITLSAIMMALYILVTYICFGYFKLSGDANIPWMLTLLIGLGIVSIFAIFAVKNEELTAKVTQGSQKRIALILTYIVLVLAPLTTLPTYVNLRTYSGIDRTEPKGAYGQKIMPQWLDACQWINTHTPKEAKFWIPRDGHTFKWYARRGDIGTWKNIPQDAASVVEWFDAMKELYHYKNTEGIKMEDRLITTLVCSKSDEELAAMQQKYGFDYVLCVQSYLIPSHTALELVYTNDVYCLYRYHD